MHSDTLMLFVIALLLIITMPVKSPVIANDKFVPTEDDINTWRYGSLTLPQNALAPGAPANASHLLSKPDTWMEDVAKHLRPHVKIPIVLYLHSCGGNDHYRWSETLSQWGFGVISPNSFARDGRRKHCGTMPGAKLFNMRMSELYYALSQIKKTSWIDQTRLILMGHSEGSFFPPAYSGDDFTAHIILAGNCRFSHLGPAPCCAPGRSKAPKHIAVLNIIGDGDEWNEWTCHETHKQRGSRFIKLKNHGHDISSTQPRAVEIMAKFLETCCGKKEIKNSTEGLDPLVSAKKLFDELGGMATIDVQLRADEAASKGDFGARDFWLAVLKEVEKIVE